VIANGWADDRVTLGAQRIEEGGKVLAVENALTLAIHVGRQYRQSQEACEGRPRCPVSAGSRSM